MWHHFVNLLARSWANVLGSLSTSTLSIVLFSLAAPVITFFVTLITVSRKHPERTIVDHARESIWPTTIGLAVPLTLLAIVFGWKTVTTVYDDHQTLAATVNSLRNAPKPVCPSFVPCPASEMNLLKRNIQSKLALLMQEGDAIRDDWKAAMAKHEKHQQIHAEKARKWHMKVESYLHTIPRGSVYVARLNSALKTGSGGWPMGIDYDVSETFDLLSSDLAILNDFANDQELGQP